MGRLALLAALIGCARLAVAGTVWIDTDVSIGSPIREVDDAYALVLALHSPEIHIAGISTSYGNAPLGHTTRVARELIRQFGGPANMRPEQVFAGATTAADIGRRTEASEALATVLKTESVTYVALGPLTNLATFLRRHPKSARKISRVIFIGGQAQGTTLAFGPRRSFHIHDANVFKDPPAAAAVVRSNIPLTLVPIATASELLLNDENLRELERQGGAGNYLARRSKVWLWFWTHFAKTKGGPIFDALALVAATRPELVSTKGRYAKMDEAGNLVVSDSLTSKARRVRFGTTFAPGTKPFVMRRLISRRGRDWHSTRDDRDVRSRGGFHERFLFKEKRPSRFDGDHAQMRFRRHLDRRDTDDRHVEAHVLAGLGDFHHDRVLSTKRAAAFDRLVRALETFHRQDRPVFHDYGLADVEPAHFPCDLKAERDVVFFAPA